MAAYYSSHKQLWEAMDHFLTFRPKYKKDIIAYAWHVEEFRIYELLADLNPRNKQLRVANLGKDPLPLSIKSIFISTVYCGST